MINKSLVLIQMLCIGVLIYYNGIFSHSLIPIILQISSAFLLIWSLYFLKNSKLSVFPEVQEGAVLIKEGPFKWLRHPIYTALLMYFWSFLFSELNSINIFLNLGIHLVIILKINREEKYLNFYFSEYKKYQSRTKKILPFIY